MMMKLHHIGYTTADITATSARFRSFIGADRKGPHLEARYEHRSRKQRFYNRT